MTDVRQLAAELEAWAATMEAQVAAARAAATALLGAYRIEAPAPQQVKAPVTRRPYTRIAEEQVRDFAVSWHRHTPGARFRTGDAVDALGGGRGAITRHLTALAGRGVLDVQGKTTTRTWGYVEPDSPGAAALAQQRERERALAGPPPTRADAAVPYTGRPKGFSDKSSLDRQRLRAGHKLKRAAPRDR